MPFRSINRSVLLLPFLSRTADRFAFVSRLAMQVQEHSRRS
jgi:hypothetical protein